LITEAKNLAKVRAGKIGARSRWGPPRVVRLHDLTPDQRRLVLALVEAARTSEKAAAACETPATANVGGHCHDRPMG
jgi:hypothetical protein